MRSEVWYEMHCRSKGLEPTSGERGLFNLLRDAEKEIAELKALLKLREDQLNLLGR